MNEELNKDAVKAIREYYNCQGKYPCSYFDHCQFGDGYNTSYDCCECGADAYYAYDNKGNKIEGEYITLMKKEYDNK